MSQSCRFFLAGIIQGSKQKLDIHSQSYRDHIKEILKKGIPQSEVFCPVEDHPNSVSYSDEEANRVFFYHLNEVRKSDCLIVFLPEASMGSAIEMWEAWHHKIPVITITPMTTNWVVRLLSNEIFEDIESFKGFVLSGKCDILIQEFKNSTQSN